MSDLDILQELEKKTKIKLKLVKFYHVKNKEKSYAIDENNNVIGLNLDRSQIYDFPFQITQLKYLKILSLLDNQLVHFLPKKGEFKNLQYLNLRYNRLVSLPPEIAKLKNLQCLDLSDNHIRQLPPEIAELKNLQTLNMNSNNLHHLPPEIAELKNLQRLDLHNNNLTWLPSEITQLKMEIGWESSEIDISANPIEKPPLEIVRRGMKAVRNYFESLKTAKKTVHVYEAKLLIVGEGGVGKTTLIKALCDKSFIFDEKDDVTTEGIDIYQWKFRFRKTDGKIYKFTANIWDFGGQEIYHATHQFFLTHRSCYLLVWEARQEYHDLGFYYWLNVISLLSDKSPVVVVMNKKDIRQKVIDEATLHEKFPNIVGFHEVSCVTGEEIPELKKNIVKTLINLPHIGTELPKTWLDIREKLETDSRNYIAYNEYVQLCKNFEMEKDQAYYLSRYFHDLAGILHFHDNPILKASMILKPEWATHAVYDVLDTKSIQANKGRFHFSELETIWDETIYPADKHPHLLELMKKFELAFQFEDTQEYLVPELLPGDTPSFPWNEGDNLKFEYRYEFMPKGILTRFIVRNHLLIEKDYYWKNGVVLSKEGTQAKVTSDYYNRKISIAIQGSYKKELFAIIRNHLEYIHTTLNYPPLQEMIPCNCLECVNDPNPHYYDYLRLMKHREKGRTTVVCDKSSEDVSIEDLLSGITPTKPLKKDEWDVFISYSIKDFAIIQEIVIDLQSHGITYWWDHEQLIPGTSILQGLEHGLDKSRNVLLCLSYNQLDSGWSKVEYTSVLNEVITGKTKQKVIPLILDELREEDIPRFLRDIKYERRLDKKRYQKLLRALQ